MTISANNGTEAALLRRKRGGQPSNQNARRHGFYSTALSDQEQEALYEAVNLKDLQPDQRGLVS